MVFRVTQTLENPTMPQIYHHLHRAMETTPLVEWLHWASVALPGRLFFFGASDVNI